MSFALPVAADLEGQADRVLHSLVVKHVVRETADATSIVLQTPPQLARSYRYRAGQFVTVRAVIEGEEYRRCYSMSSAPEVDDALQITAKRVPGGVVSNWLNESVVEGQEIETTVPGGDFVLDDTDRDLVAFAGGSGITPVFSLVKSALATTQRRVRLLYANTTRSSIIFADALDVLAAQHPDRLEIVHHLDDEHGLVGTGDAAGMLAPPIGVDVYICGPVPFMDTVESAAVVCGVPASRVHLERFTAPPGDDVDGVESEVTIRIGNKTAVKSSPAGSTLLQAARNAGLRAPSSCEQGTCATCIARVVEGRATMRQNDALTPEEVDEGWVLTCSALPTTPSITVVYE